jgi:hypothetical protein
MRRLALFAVLSMLAVPAMALAQNAAPPPPDQPAMQPPPPDQPGMQPPPPGQPGDMGPPGAPPGRPHGGHDAMMEKWHARFDAANTTHDGHLTLQQAEAAGMKPIVAHFTAIDFHHRGYVTFNDIMAWHLDDMAKHLEHRAAELRAQD